MPPLDARPGINPITGETINRSIATGLVPVISPSGGPYRSRQEAIDDWRADSLRGSNIPLSAYLQNVVPQPGEPEYRGGGGGGGGGLATARSPVPYGEQTETTGLSSRSSLAEMPPDVRERYLAYLDSVEGLPSGYTEAEQAGMQIGPEEAGKLARFAIDPTVGAANRARSELGALYAASGGFNPGMNATMQEIQREQGRQAAEASLKSRLAVSEVNRKASELAANARIQGEQFGRTQRANLLTAFPERKTATTGTSTDKITSRPTLPSGEPFPSTAQPPGTSLDPLGIPRPSKTPKPSLWESVAGSALEGSGLAPTVGDRAKKKKTTGGLAYAY